MGRLHSLIYHLQQRLGELLEVHLVAHPDAKGLKSLLGVVLGAVEAPIDEGLDPAP
jgi:hypothetical protein